MQDDAEIYDERYYRNLPVDSGRIRSLLRLMQFDYGDSVCEIGCAAGHFLAEISPLIGEGIGIDVSEPAIHAANSLRVEKGLKNIRFEKVSAAEFVLRSGNNARFDHVLLLDVTEHIDDTTLALIFEAAKRLLKPKGMLTIHTPNLTYWLEQLKDKGIIKQVRGHIAVRSEKEYRALFDGAGLVEHQIIGLPHYLQPLRLFDQLLMPVPFLGRLFRSRLFIKVAARGEFDRWAT
jgi:2-polyprenyl-3-methyl-5-hydroxy-6-metoxy-1,4-benzoquinol methylase